VGLPLRKDFKIRIVNDNEVDRGVGQVGEIVINTPTLMSGYCDQENVGKDVLKDGWFYTGDYGYLDEGGYLYFTGVIKNIAKVGGNMVDLREVQNVLLSHPFISDAVVSSREDELWGHVVVAEVVPEVNGELKENDIRTFCSKRLSGHKVPKTIELSTGARR
jgi:acyl-CoA synthetase (AMP-forming)/AMP-acid ligase II